MKHAQITEAQLDFLRELAENNNRDWFSENKKRFREVEAGVKFFFQALRQKMESHDAIEQVKVFRIYRDVRFSIDKTPYKTHFAGSLSRAGADRRGGYYLQVQPGESFIAAGFWEPNPQDLFRIRKEWENGAERLREIMEDPTFIKVWGKLQGESVKTAPKGFSKEDPNIDLIRKKRFIFVHHYSDREVLAPDFLDSVNAAFKGIRPFFDLMSEILTTNLNGESLVNR